MKFAIAAIFTLALAMGAQSSIVPWGVHSEIAGHGLAYTAVSGPAAVAVHAPAAVAVHGAPWGVAGLGPWGGVWGPSVVAGHGPVVVAGHAPVVVAGHGHEGTYVAQTRGAVHTAPLAGHIASAASINVAPAPGTV